MSEDQDGAFAPVTNAPGTLPEGQTSESEKTVETGATENEQGQTEQQTEEQKKSKFQRRLERQKTARIQAETEARLLRERVAELEGRSKTQATADAGKEPKREDFESYEDFIAARAEYRAEKRATETVEKRLKEADEQRNRQKSTAEQKALEDNWNASLETARDKYDDFEEVMSESEVPTSQHMTRAIMESEAGAEVAYYLAKHPEEAERIAKLSPVRQIAEIGKLEDKVSQAKAPPKKPSSAPEPLNPVGGAKSGANETALSDNLSTEEWVRRRNAQVNRR